MQESLGKRGTAMVALITAAVVAGSMWLAFGGDDMRSTPVAGREADAARPQGREAPGSQEGLYGAGSPAQRRGLTDPDVNPNPQAGMDTGRNAPPDPNATVQRAPETRLPDGANADPEESARIPR
ncbi:MAG: hypothetical protein M3M95_08510 [Pseudomonadota bacterium]|nr:hypothetical protein [Pseudomonadota bacterium]